MEDVDWRALAGRFTASSPASCTSDVAMVSRRAMWDRRQQIELLERRRAALEELKRFTFRAKRPFHPERLFKCLSRGQSSSCRIEGIGWLASRNDEHALVRHPPLSYSGSASAVSITRGPPWWASTPHSEWPDGLAEDLNESNLWSSDYGDRQVEIYVSHKEALPGADLHNHESLKNMLHAWRTSIETELTSCLLTDAELELGPEAWQDLLDPFLVKQMAQPFAFAGMFGMQRDGISNPALCSPCGEPTWFIKSFAEE